MENKYIKDLTNLEGFARQLNKSDQPLISVFSYNDENYSFLQNNDKQLVYNSSKQQVLNDRQIRKLTKLAEDPNYDDSVAVGDYLVFDIKNNTSFTTNDLSECLNSEGQTFIEVLKAMSNDDINQIFNETYQAYLDGSYSGENDTANNLFKKALLSDSRFPTKYIGGIVISIDKEEHKCRAMSMLTFGQYTEETYPVLGKGQNLFLTVPMLIAMTFTGNANQNYGTTDTELSYVLYQYNDATGYSCYPTVKAINNNYYLPGLNISSTIANAYSVQLFDELRDVYSHYDKYSPIPEDPSNEPTVSISQYLSDNDILNAPIPSPYINGTFEKNPNYWIESSESSGIYYSISYRFSKTVFDYSSIYDASFFPINGSLHDCLKYFSDSSQSKESWINAKESISGFCPIVPISMCLKRAFGSSHGCTVDMPELPDITMALARRKLIYDSWLSAISQYITPQAKEDIWHIIRTFPLTRNTILTKTPMTVIDINEETMTPILCSSLYYVDLATSTTGSNFDAYPKLNSGIQCNFLPIYTLEYNE